MSRILIIDDDIEACETMVSLVTRLSYNSDRAHNLEDGLRLAQASSYDVVFLDVYLPDGNGLDILPALMATTDPPEVIILTGKGDPDGAELAIQGGVWDYLLKPTSVRDITLTLNRALKYRKEKKGSSRQAPTIEGVVGSSQIIKASVKLTSKAASSDANVLITGETGTGKELIASIIHKNSGRCSGNFVVVDCTSLSESLIESTLFGHLKGSFTGAELDRQGLIKTADGGTLFLDEVGEMPLSIQKVFLRVLQERQFRPVGATAEQTSNFRLIAATNRDLDQMVENGEFRNDLLFRIKTMRIHLPTLRQRIGDVQELANYRVGQLCKDFGMGSKDYGEKFFDTLSNYSWPGNVRELFNILERAVVDAGDENTLYAMHLPRSLRIEVAKAQISQLTSSVDTENENSGIDPLVQDIGQQIFEDIFDRPLPQLKGFKNTAEKTYLGELIRQSDGNIQNIMKTSGLSRSHFYSLLKKYNLSL
ncbi:MAG: sigma-54-dependent Fis family transcriptional regulator [Desulfobulbaceae bacterium]|nr:sigma-54-dependent Fis family transcriptional regulator [Desulfobulbaceae bacterium]